MREFRFVSLLLQGSILHKYSLEMSGKVREFDHDWRVAILQLIQQPHSSLLLLSSFDWRGFLYM